MKHREVSQVVQVHTEILEQNKTESENSAMVFQSDFPGLESQLSHLETVLSGGKLYNFQCPSFLIWKLGIIFYLSKGLLWEFSQIIYIHILSEFLAYKKYLTLVNHQFINYWDLFWVWKLNFTPFNKHLLFSFYYHKNFIWKAHNYVRVKDV